MNNNVRRTNWSHGPRIAVVSLAALLFAAGLMVASVVAEDPHHKMFHHIDPSEPTLDYDSLWNAATPIDKSPDGARAMADCMSTYGGAQHLKDLQSVLLSWRMKIVYVEDTVDVNRAAAFDRKHYIERKRGDHTEKRIINGDQAWLQTPDSVIDLPSIRYKSELFSYLVMSMPLAMETEPFSEIRFGHRSSDSLDYFYMNKEDSLLVIIGVDPRDHMIHKAEGVITEGDKQAVFINHFSQHSEWDGYIFPGHMVNVSMGLKVGESDLREAKVNFASGKNTFLPAVNTRQSHLH